MWWTVCRPDGGKRSLGGREKMLLIPNRNSINDDKFPVLCSSFESKQSKAKQHKDRIRNHKTEYSLWAKGTWINSGSAFSIILMLQQSDILLIEYLYLKFFGNMRNSIILFRFRSLTCGGSRRLIVTGFSCCCGRCYCSLVSFIYSFTILLLSVCLYSVNSISVFSRMKIKIKQTAKAQRRNSRII